MEPTEVRETLLQSEIASKSTWEKIKDFIGMLCCCCMVFGISKRKINRDKTPINNTADRHICCCCRIFYAIGNFCTGGVFKNNANNTNNHLAKDKEIATEGTQDPPQVPVIDAVALDLLAEVERQSDKLYNEHKALRNEADGHIKEIAQKFVMIMSLGLTGSVGVGLLTCGIAFHLSILYFAVLIVTMTPIFYLGWVRLNGCYCKLFAKMSEQDDFLVYLKELKQYYIKSAIEVQITVSSTNTETSSKSSVSDSASEEYTVKGPPPVPQINRTREFKRRLDAAIGITKSDTRDCLCMARFIVACVNMWGYFHCAAISYVLYVGVCKGEKKADSSGP